MAIKMPSQAEFDKARDRLEVEGQIDRYTQMIKSGIGNNAIWYNLGVAHTQKQEWDEAKEAFQKSLELQPENPQAWVNLGAVHYRQGDYVEAEKCNRKALEIYPEFFHARSNLGMVLMLLGKYRECVDEMMKVLEQEPEHPVALAALSQSWDHLGDAEKAAEFKSKAEELGVKFESK